MDVTLFCIPFAGGNKQSYRSYQKILPPDFQIVVLEYPGRGMRGDEDLLTNMDDLANDLFGQMKNSISRESYAIYGHSMGGILAWLIALRIRDHHLPAPSHLFITGIPGPSSLAWQREKFHLYDRKKLFEEMKLLQADEKYWETLLQAEGIMDYYEPIIRADFKANETYIHRSHTPLNVPMTVITGMKEEWTEDEARTWQLESTLPVDIRRMEGGHFFIFNHPQEVVELLKQKLLAREPQVYLKPNTVIEPLFDRWYAWPHLISPATSALNVTERHMTIMDSFILAPELHEEYVRNPGMRGGPFMDHPSDAKQDIEALREKTKKRRAKVIEFANAIKELDNLLLSEAKGFSLQPLYDKIPKQLKGYVQLHYDRNNNPDFRFFESLLYDSEYYQRDAQTIALWLTNNDHRPFVLSTPRLDDENVLFLDIPFDNMAIDELAKMKRTPQTADYIKKKLGITKDQEALFDTFLTTEQPRPYVKYTGDKIRMRYFGHACIFVETKDVSILIDPLVSYYGYPAEIDRFSDMDLPEIIDYVIISHNHIDHILFETLLSLRHRIKNLVVPRTYGGKLEDPDLKLMFEKIGFTNVIEVGNMDTLKFEDVSITALPFTGEHADMDILTRACYYVRIHEFKLIFFADSKILEPDLYKHIHKQIGDVDVIFLGMECDGAPLSWLYGPLVTKKITRDQDNSRRVSGSDCAQGMAVVNIFKPTEVYVYAMGQEPWIEYISSIKYTDESNPIVQSNKLVKLCTERGLVAERLFGEKELLYETQVSYEVE